VTTPAEKKALLARKAAAINKSFGKTVVATADKVKNPYFVRRPTGIMELDIDMAGGFPPGVSFISGPDGSGKSHLLYRTMAMHQRLYGERSAIALAAVESPIDHLFMRKLGVIIAVPDDVIEEKNNWRKEMGLPPFTKDEIKDMKRQIGSFWDVTGATMEQTLMTVIDILGDKSLREADNQFGIVGIDSLNALIPQAWQATDLDENAQRAAHAACLTRFFAQYYPLSTALDGDQIYTSILFTQQVRSNPAKSTAPSHIAKFLPDYTTIGAYAGKHGKLIDVMLTNGAKKKDKREEGANAKAETNQKTLCWELTKGKAGTHEGKTGEVAFEFGTEDYIDLQRTVLVSGMKHGVLLEKNGLLSHMGHVQKDSPVREDLRIKNMPADALIKRMKDDVAFEYMLRRDVLAANKIECRYF
jgi:RecA/RadA recombinase